MASLADDGARKEVEVREQSALQAGRHVCMRGQVFRSERWRYKKIFFFDILLGRTSDTSSPHEDLAGSTTQEEKREAEEALRQLLCTAAGCIVKENQGFTEEAMRVLRSTLHSGDEVMVRGVVEEQQGAWPSVLCSSVEVLSRWSDSHPAGVLFLWPNVPSAVGEGEEAAKKMSSPRENEAAGSLSLEEWLPVACKQWVNTGRCQTAKCRKVHCVPANLTMAEARQQWVAARVAARSTGEHEHAGPKCQRAPLFCDWLEKTFGKESLAKGVLDVAGGKGEITFELAVKRGFKSVVVDPRPVRFSKPHYRHFKRAHKARRKAGAKEAFVMPEVTKVMPQEMCLFDEQFLRTHASLVEETAVVVGMHPDEATEPLVDHALASGKPFAVVPCCVFAAQNPHRKLADGTPVASYGSYVTYLKEKAPELIRTGHLPFPGRNLVLYSLGKEI